MKRKRTGPSCCKTLHFSSSRHHKHIHTHTRTFWAMLINIIHLLYLNWNSDVWTDYVNSYLFFPEVWVNKWLHKRSTSKYRIINECSFCSGWKLKNLCLVITGPLFSSSRRFPSVTLKVLLVLTLRHVYSIIACTSSLLSFTDIW